MVRWKGEESEEFPLFSQAWNGQPAAHLTLFFFVLVVLVSVLLTAPSTNPFPTRVFNSQKKKNFPFLRVFANARMRQRCGILTLGQCCTEISVHKSVLPLSTS